MRKQDRGTSKDAFGDRNSKSRNEFTWILPSSMLNIHLKLVLFKPVIDVTGDSKVIKKILKEGEGTISANDGAAVYEQVLSGLD